MRIKCAGEVKNGRCLEQRGGGDIKRATVPESSGLPTYPGVQGIRSNVVPLSSRGDGLSLSLKIYLLSLEEMTLSLSKDLFSL
jgi:hypothetical protein